jgi:prevent-host-death family protein
MSIVNIHDAKTQFSKLVDQAAAGETVIIAKAGKPVAKLVGLTAPIVPSRLGFLAGQFLVPDDFDTMGAEDIAEMFNG